MRKIYLVALVGVLVLGGCGGPVGLGLGLGSANFSPRGNNIPVDFDRMVLNVFSQSTYLYWWQLEWNNREVWETVRLDAFSGPYETTLWNGTRYIWLRNLILRPDTEYRFVVQFYDSRYRPEKTKKPRIDCNRRLIQNHDPDDFKKQYTTTRVFTFRTR